MLNFPVHLAYYRNLHLKSTISSIKFRFRGQSIIYGIRCRMTNMIYIGSTSQSLVRFNRHLETGRYSNPSLQNDISKYGLESFTAYIFESLKIDDTMNKSQVTSFIRESEQKYINLFPKKLLYNRIDSFIKKSPFWVLNCLPRAKGSGPAIKHC